MRSLRSLLILAATLGCAAQQINGGYHPAARSAVVVAVVPFPTELQQNGFASAFAQGRTSVLPAATMRETLAKNPELREILSEIADTTWIWQLKRSLAERIGDAGLAKLRATFAPADLLLLPISFQLRQTLWHVMSGSLMYRLYDLHDGAFIAQDETSLSVDTNPSLGVDDLDEAAVTKILASFGAHARKLIEQRVFQP